ncbi:uncharacterized protein MAL13P1.304-like, partial [Lucilia sericata]|uniref:uncharacterized protein MAL13P1.304-like n=1 Tax=Lucilia sericata TaxID=13632 RepID=UPI0018A80B9C
VLYHEIVSHARVVSACIRAASEKEQQKKQQLQQQQQLQHDSYNTDASLIAEQTNSSLSSTDDTTTTTATTATNTTNTTTATTSGVVCSDHLISPNSAAAAATSVASGHTSKKSDNNNLDRLQNRYHLLYLKAFEVQLWLDGLLRKKSSSVGNLTNEDLDSEDIDDSIDYSDDCLDDDGPNLNRNEEDGATEDDLNDVASDLESDITHNSLSYNDNDDNLQQQHNYNNHQQQQQRLQHQHKKQKQQNKQQKHQLCHSSDIDENQTINVSSHHHHPQQQHLQSSSRDCIQTKIDCEDCVDEEDDDVEIEEEAEDGDDEDEIDSPNHKNQLGYTKLLVTFDRSSGRSSAAAQHKANATLTDFEADSESSDLETIQRCMRSSNQRNTTKAHHYTPMSYKFLGNNAGSLITGHSNKRSTICGSVTNLNLAAAVINNASELESCEIDDDMQTTAATAVSTITAHTIK